jgi:soluble lytic murein transglycosylase-like protein
MALSVNPPYGSPMRAERPSLRRRTVARAAIAALLALTTWGGSCALAETTIDATTQGPAALPILVSQAIAYEHGEGVPKDQAKAASLYCQAALAGNADALYGLGWMYANGRGVPRDDTIAAALFARAAKGGHVYAMKMQQYVGDDSNVVPECMRIVAVPPARPVLADGPDPFVDLPPKKRKIADMVETMAPGYAIEPRLALAVIAAESNFQPDARSDKDARGLMQLLPSTAARFKVKNLMDAKDNVKGGLAYLRWLLSYYQGQVALAIAAYNAGEGAVDKYGGVPPYPETQGYVQRVQRLFPRDHHPYDPHLVEPSIILVPAVTGAK